MTEAEWQSSTDPMRMLDFLRGKVSNRKVRLFQVACCRRIWSLLPDDTCRRAVLVAERYADGYANDRERRAIRNQIASYGEQDNLTEINARGAVFYANEKTVLKTSTGFLGVAAVVGNAAKLTDECGSVAYIAAYQAEQKSETRLLRCIFDNPFHSPRTLPPSILVWNDSIVVKLAHGIYEERAFDRMPILGDALEDGGCANSDILTHCRQHDEHARGCWVIDLILGKA